MKRAIFEKKNGSLRIFSPAPGIAKELGGIEKLVQREIDRGILPSDEYWFIIDDRQIPNERALRDAWRLTEGKINIDKKAAQKEIRHSRDTSLKELDHLAIAAERARDDEMIEAVEIEAKRLRDLPTTKEFKSKTPKNLIYAYHRAGLWAEK